jgi:flavodoxin
MMASMQVLLIYDSEFGNTRELALAAASELNTLGSVQTVAAVSFNAAALTSAIDFLVVCGPTQAHGISPTMRQMLGTIPNKALDGVPFATFDTRVHGARWITGAASNGIAKQLKRKGGRLVAPPESFLVSGREGPLAEGELERCKIWARELARTAAAQRVTASAAR